MPVYPTHTLYYIPCPIYRLPFVVFHLPYTMYHLPYTIYHLPYIIYHIPYTTSSGPLFRALERGYAEGCQVRTSSIFSGALLELEIRGGMGANPPPYICIYVYTCIYIYIHTLLCTHTYIYIERETYMVYHITNGVQHKTGEVRYVVSQGAWGRLQSALPREGTHAQCTKSLRAATLKNDLWLIVRTPTSPHI